MRLNIKGAIDAAGLTEQQVARELFPSHRFPEKALQRVLAGDGYLDSRQISKLAAVTNVPVGELFGGQITMVSKGAVHTITTGDFRAELDIISGVTKIYRNCSLVHETVLHSPSITLSEYLKQLQFIISSL